MGGNGNNPFWYRGGDGRGFEYVRFIENQKVMVFAKGLGVCQGEGASMGETGEGGRFTSRLGQVQLVDQQERRVKGRGHWKTLLSQKDVQGVSKR